MTECRYFYLDEFSYERCEIFGEPFCDACQFAPIECDICEEIIDSEDYDKHMEKVHNIIDMEEYQ